MCEGRAYLSLSAFYHSGIQFRYVNNLTSLLIIHCLVLLPSAFGFFLLVVLIFRRFVLCYVYDEWKISI
jgi:hypothetical protein